MSSEPPTFSRSGESQRPFLCPPVPASEGKAQRTSASGEMMTFTFENGCVATLRPSGTEPKLKYYAEMSAATPGAARRQLAAMVVAIVAEMIEPEKHGLAWPMEAAVRAELAP